MAKEAVWLDEDGDLGHVLLPGGGLPNAALLRLPPGKASIVGGPGEEGGVRVVYEK